MSERIPKEYELPSAPIAADDYVPPRTTNDLEATWRQASRGTGALIMRQQAEGIDVGRRWIGFLRPTGYESMAARIVAGSLFVSSKYLFDAQPRKAMFRRLALPEIAREDQPWMDTAGFDDLVFDQFDSAIKNSAELSERLRRGTESDNRIFRLGGEVGRLGVALAQYPIAGFGLNEAYYEGSVYHHQLDVRNRATQAYDEMVELAKEIGTAPSAAQLSLQVSALGSHLMTDRRYPSIVVRAFKDAQEEVEEENRMVAG